MHKLSFFAVRRPITISVLVIIVVLFGIISLPRIGIDLLPNLDYPAAVVVTAYPGAHPEMVEKDVTIPIESALAGVSGINRIDEIESIFNPILHFEQCIDIKKVNELYSYINLSKILLKVMNYRKESRGPHYRRDFPDMDSSYNGRISVRKDGEGLEFSLI